MLFRIRGKSIRGKNIQGLEFGINALGEKGIRAIGLGILTWNPQNVWGIEGVACYTDFTPAR